MAEEALDNPTEVEFEDKIWDEPETVMFVSDPEKIDMINSNDHYPIIAFLRNGYHTVKEITNAYPSYSKVPEKSVKSDKTIYRYLNDLKKVGLVKVVGQRVIRGQTATEKIWGRTAKIFYIDNKENVPAENACGDDCLACADDGAHLDSLKGLAIVKLLEQVLGPSRDIENYAAWMSRLDSMIKDEIMELINAIPEDELRYLARLPYTAIDHVLTISALMALFKEKYGELEEFYSLFSKDD